MLLLLFLCLQVNFAETSNDNITLDENTQEDLEDINRQTKRYLLFQILLGQTLLIMLVRNSIIKIICPGLILF